MVKQIEFHELSNLLSSQELYHTNQMHHNISDDTHSNNCQYCNDITCINLKVADENLNLELFLAATIGWFRANPECNFQDLELYLRENDFNTYLYPRKPITSYNGYKYECIFCCRPQKEAYQQVIKEWGTYKKSFKKLKYTGSTILNKSRISEIKGSVHFTDQTKKDLDDISYNRKIAVVTNIEPKIFIADMIEKLTEKYGQKPDKYIYDTAEVDGSPIYGFMINNKLVSEYGYIQRPFSKDLPEFEVLKIM